MVRKIKEYIYIEHYNIETIGLILLILSVPIMINTPGNSLFPGPIGSKIQIVDFIFLFLLAAWLYKLCHNQVRFNRTSLAVPLVFYLVASLLSLLNSSNIKDGLVEFIGILYLIALFYLIVNAVRDRKMFEMVINSWLITSALVAFLGILGIFLAYVFDIKTFLVKEYAAFPYLGNIYRAYSTFGVNSKFVSSYLTISFPICLALLLNSKAGKKRLFYCITLILFICVLFFTFSRGWLGLAVAIYLVLSRFQRPEKYYRYLKVLTAIFIILFGLFIFLISRWQFVDFQTKKITVENSTNIEPNIAFTDNGEVLEKIRVETGYMDTTYYRLKRVAIEMILDHPLIGVGLGGFNDEIRRYKEEKELSDIFPAMDPHCMILGKAAQTGLVGLIALVILWGKSIRKALNMSFTSRDNYFQIISWAMFSSMVGFVIQSIDMDIMNFRFLWFLFAFVFVVESLESTSKSHICEGPQT
jgi:hypothetical protein